MAHAGDDPSDLSSGPAGNLLTSHPSRKVGLGDVEPIRPAPTGKQIKHSGNDPGPSCLVTRPQTGAIVPMEIFIEQNVIFPVRFVLKLLGSPYTGRLPPASRKKMLDIQEGLGGNHRVDSCFRWRSRCPQDFVPKRP